MGRGSDGCQNCCMYSRVSGVRRWNPRATAAAALTAHAASMAARRGGRCLRPLRRASAAMDAPSPATIKTAPIENQTAVAPARPART